MTHALGIDTLITNKQQTALTSDIERAIQYFNLKERYEGAKTYGDEAVAEVFKMFVVNPQQASIDFPELTKVFESIPEAKGIAQAYQLFLASTLDKTINGKSPIKYEDVTWLELIKNIKNTKGALSRLYGRISAEFLNDDALLNKLEKQIKELPKDRQERLLPAIDRIRKLTDIITDTIGGNVARLMGAVGKKDAYPETFDKKRVKRIDKDGNVKGDARTFLDIYEHYGILKTGITGTIMKGSYTEKGRIYSDYLVLRSIEELFHIDKKHMGKSAQARKRIEMATPKEGERPSLELYAENMGIPDFKLYKEDRERYLKTHGLEKEFEEFAEEFSETFRGIVYGYLGHEYFNDKQLKAFTRRQYYVPFFRDGFSPNLKTFFMGLIQGDFSGQRFKQSTAGVRDITVKGLKGSDRPIVDPLRNVHIKLNEIVQTTWKNHTAKEAAKILEALNDSGIQVGIEGIKAVKGIPQEIHSTDFVEFSREFKDNVAKLLEGAGYEGYNGDIREALGSAPIGRVIKLVKNDKKVNVFFVRDKGVLKAYEISDPEVFTYFDKTIYRNLGYLSVSNPYLKTLLKGWTAFAGYIRNLIIAMPPFKFHNFVGMDSRTAWVNSDIPVSKRPIYLKKAFSEFTNSGELYKKFVADGGVIGRNPSAEANKGIGVFKEYLEERLSEIRIEKGGFSKWANFFPRWYWDGLESYHRLAEYIHTYEKMKKEGYNEFEARLEAIDKAKNVTINFSKSSPFLRYVSQFVPFTSAGWAALRTEGNAVLKAIKDPKRIALFLMAYTIPTLINYYNNKNEEWYDAISPFYKGLYEYHRFGNTIVKIRTGGLHKLLFSDIPRMIAEKFDKGEVFENSEEFFDYLKDVGYNLPIFGNIFTGDMDVGPIARVITGIFGKTTWGSDVVPESKKNLPAPEQWRASTPLALTALSDWVYHNISPAIAFSPAKAQNWLYILGDKTYKGLYIFDPLVSPRASWGTVKVKAAITPDTGLYKALNKRVDDYYRVSKQLKGYTTTIKKYVIPKTNEDSKAKSVVLTFNKSNRKIGETVNALYNAMAVGLVTVDNEVLNRKYDKQITEAINFMKNAQKSKYLKGYYLGSVNGKSYYLSLDPKTANDAIEALKKIRTSLRKKIPLAYKADDVERYLDAVALARQQIAEKTYYILKDAGIIKEAERLYAGKR